MPPRPRGSRWEENGWLMERRVTYSKEDGTIRPRNVRVVKVKVKKPKVKRCLVCNKPLYEGTPKQKFCSDRHRAYHHRGFVPKKVQEAQAKREEKRLVNNANARERYRINRERELAMREREKEREALKAAEALKPAPPPPTPEEEKAAIEQRRKEARASEAAAKARREEQELATKDSRELDYSLQDRINAIMKAKKSTT